MRQTNQSRPGNGGGSAWLRQAALAVALSLLAAACGSDAPTDARYPGGILPGASEPPNGSGQCMGDDAVDYGGVDGIAQGATYGTGGNTLNCTANDIEIAYAEVHAVQVMGEGGAMVFKLFEDFVEPPTCVEGEDVTLQMAAILKQNANSERQDVGIWIATDGGNAETGECNHYNLIAGTEGTTNGDGDQCAGMAEADSTHVELGILTVPCEPDPATSQLSIGSCLSWKVPSDDLICPDNADGMDGSGEPTDFRAGTLPSNKSKCNCEPFVVPVVVLKEALIEVRKVCVPAGDAGTFDLEIDNVGDDDYYVKNDALCGQTTGQQVVGAGTLLDPGADHTVSESDFTAANYVSTLACTRNGDPYIAEEAYTAGTDRTVHVDPDDVVVCTFKNVRKSSLKIVKDAVPNHAQDFAFTTSGAGLSSFDLDDDADGTLPNEKLFSNLTPGGARSVTEGAVVGWTLTNIACTGATSSTVAIVGANADPAFQAGDNQVNVTLAAGENVVCTYTNTKQGSIKIVKDTKNPETDPEDFAFTASGTGMTPSPFSLDDDADGTLSNEQLFSGLLPNGTRSVSEGAETAWVLTSISCTGVTSSTVAFVGANADPAFQAGDNQVNIGLAAGENLVCTFRNERKARLIVEKEVVGGGTQSFDFSRNPGAVSFALLNGQSNNSGYSLLPATYRVCELSLAVSWAASATVNGGAATLINPDAPADNGNRCVDVPLAYGDSKTVHWINTPPPGGDARTPGYWKNWSSCSNSNGKQYEKALAPGGFGFDKTLDGNLPQLIGDLDVDTCLEGIRILSRQNVLTGANQPGDAAYILASQLLAAKLNISAGAGSCPDANTAIANAQNFLANVINFTGAGTYLKLPSANKTTALGYAATLDSYNNNTLCSP